MVIIVAVIIIQFNSIPFLFTYKLNKNTAVLCGFHVARALLFSVPYRGDDLQIYC
jgi:hypothetical protein